MPSEIKKALVIDDEESLREIIAEVLNIMDIEVVSAENGEKGLELAASNPEQIDFVFLDLFMPGMSGEETLAKLKNILPDRPIILMSGYDQGNPEVARLMNGSSIFLKKPFTISDIQNIVSSFG